VKSTRQRFATGSIRQINPPHCAVPSGNGRPCKGARHRRKQCAAISWACRRELPCRCSRPSPPSRAGCSSGKTCGDPTSSVGQCRWPRSCRRCSRISTIQYRRPFLWNPRSCRTACQPLRSTIGSICWTGRSPPLGIPSPPLGVPSLTPAGGSLARRSVSARSLTARSPLPAYQPPPTALTARHRSVALARHPAARDWSAAYGRRSPLAA
jgi:hypothetical protein